MGHIKYHFGTMDEIQRQFFCCDDPCMEEMDRSYPPDDDFLVEYRCDNCNKRVVDRYKLICMEEWVEDNSLCTFKEPCEHQREGE